jgi:hypothetical protein
MKIKLINLLKEAKEDYLNQILDRISAAKQAGESWKKVLSKDEKAYLKAYGDAIEKGINVADIPKPDIALDFDDVVPGQYAKFKKEKEAEYEVIATFYGREYDTKGKKYDKISTFGFAVDPGSEIAQRHGAAMGGEGEIASLRKSYEHPMSRTLMGLEGNFDDLQFVVAATEDMSTPRIYIYAYPGGLYVPV